MQDPAFVQDAFAKIARRYDATNHVLSLGTDILWRRKVAGVVARLRPHKVLDIATGTGDLAAAISDKCPGAQITGVDFSEPMLEIARQRNIPRLELIHADAMQLPFADGSFDVVTISFGLRNLANWPDAIWEMARVTRPGGSLVVFDFSLPQNALMRGPYRFYLHKLIPRVAGWITGHREAYAYLAGSIETFPSGDAMCDLIKANGFSIVRDIPVSMGIATIYVATKVAGRRPGS
jgi:demethylmenaquinone methyltransferase/2-methoxy-6-polyprenyl-1,4-benzoquinol methylase